MANTAKPKRKYPETREFKSETVKGNKLASEKYTTDVRTVLTIKGSLSGEAYDDVIHAIDEVLKYHGL